MFNKCIDLNLRMGKSENEIAVENSTKLSTAKRENQTKSKREKKRRTNGFSHNSDKRTTGSLIKVFLPVYPKLIKIFHRSSETIAASQE